MINKYSVLKTNYVTQSTTIYMQRRMTKIQILFAKFTKKVRSNFVCHSALFKSCVIQNSNQKNIQFWVKLIRIPHLCMCLNWILNNFILIVSDFLGYEKLYWLVRCKIYIFWFWIAFFLPNWMLSPANHNFLNCT